MNILASISFLSLLIGASGCMDQTGAVQIPAVVMAAGGAVSLLIMSRTENKKDPSKHCNAQGSKKLDKCIIAQKEGNMKSFEEFVEELKEIMSGEDAVSLVEQCSDLISKPTVIHYDRMAGETGRVIKIEGSVATLCVAVEDIMVNIGKRAGCDNEKELVSLFTTISTEAIRQCTEKN